MGMLTAKAQDAPTKASPELLRFQADQWLLSNRLATAKKELIQTVNTVGNSRLKAATAERLVAQKETEVRNLQERLDATEKSIAALQGRPGPAQPRPVGAPVAVTIEPPRPTVLGMNPSDFFGGAATVLLLFPLVLALSQRILRGGKRRDVGIEANPQITRLEQAVEAIAIEVERIGEAQRFAAKLASEKPREPVIERLLDSPRPPRRVVTPLP